MENSQYLESIQAQRLEREKRLVANPRNWFSLAGLFWLEPGENTFGADPSNPIHLPAAPAPFCGGLYLHNNTVTLKHALEGVRVNGELPPTRPLQTDHDDTPDFIECGSLRMLVLRRGEKTLLRVWDTKAKAVKDFRGLNYFPIDAQYRIEAEYLPYNPPVLKKGTDAIGTETEVEFSGQVRFTLSGVDCTLEAQADDEGLMLHFSDLTKKDTTYPGGRYLLTSVPENGRVMLDFNQAVNWPCAYTQFATCPLTPFENALQLRIEAGEKRYHD
jgi:uncharacterized protein (DUF1684 family)